jgi:uncharacterized protein YggE
MNITERENIISVTGYGRLFIEPNFLILHISIGCRSHTMKTSLDNVNADMNGLLKIISSCKLNKRFVHIVDLDFGPKYEWKNDIREFLGYDVNQEVNIEIDATKENEEKARKIISEITSLKYFYACNIVYGLKSKGTYLETVRELSFKNAVEKAEQYAALAGVKIVKANTIKDMDSVNEYSRSNAHLCAEAPHYISDSHLPKGRKIVLENTVYVTFDIEK